ncbi:hypothetical protein EVAR_94351_1 [Eumeta japonica]|uniref:Uncharacterized protein n=1 Tax=Eumeta variegata TaxID=151549 RepID=A0A4C1TPV9_EUMVA|nr:hypothetical protein EVAR_94351_1 [Eumeta japonica]
MRYSFGDVGKVFADGPANGRRSELKPSTPAQGGTTTKVQQWRLKAVSETPKGRSQFNSKRDRRRQS